MNNFERLLEEGLDEGKREKQEDIITRQVLLSSLAINRKKPEFIVGDGAYADDYGYVIATPDVDLSVLKVLFKQGLEFIKPSKKGKKGTVDLIFKLK